MPEFLFKLQLYKKRAQRFSSEFYKIFENTIFTEHLWMTASILQQLLALYFIYNSYIYLATFKSWEVISLEKNSSIYLKDFTDLDFFVFIFFSLTNAYS